MSGLLMCLYSQLLLFILLINQSCYGWDADDYELFDLVEEVNQNFYEFLNISQDSTNSEIRRAYHKLSLKLHPDHNDDSQADNQFRLLVAIYDVLRDEGKRQKYDQILKVGLPNWKSPLYYYRKVRKLGLLEISIILAAIFTIGHYIVLWSVYLERRYEIEEVLSSKLKRRDKKLKKGRQVNDATCELIAEKINELSKPSLTDLLPFLIFGGIKSLISRIPEFIIILKSKIVKEKVEEDDYEDESNADNDDSTRKTRRKRVLEIPEYAPELLSAFVKEDEPLSNQTEKTESQQVSVPNSNVRMKVWSQKDIAALTKVMVRYPSGTPQRWEKIAADLQRSLKDVTEMVKTLRNNSESKHISAELQGVTASNLTNSFQMCEATSREVISTEPSEKDTLKSKPSSFIKTSTISEAWTQLQQKTLEQAIIKFPKGTDERWDKIAECIPDKSKEECFQRYKHLVEKVKLKRQK